MKTMQHGCCSLERAAILRCKGGKHSFLLRKLSFLFLFSFFVSPSFSNNICITGTVKVSESSSHSDTLLLSFSLRWDHSWRDEFNWDAAWVFLKYKTASGAWQPVYLSPGGHRFTDASGSALPFGSMEGETDGKTVGVFIYRTTLESGNTPEIRCHLLCPRSSLGGLPAEAFQRNEAFVLAQGIEMVYIPYGAYYAGDSSSFHTIADAVGHPILVDSEGSVFLSAGGSSYTLSSSYPKGYKGFYVMKYEVSQEQYVTFLNNLTYTQQQERVPGLASFSKGDYIFGDASRPSSRNGIIVAVPSEGGRAVIFANNLNNDTKYSQSDDGKTLACNYLSPEDMIAYLSWSGLRPMSELEYEKACRAPYPELPLEKEYAWHENSGVNVLGAVVSSGERTEKSGTVGANVNAGNRFSGPVRCGLFATGSSSQRDAGASFWGVMEMSGNLRELCYNVSAANAFSGDVYGDGSYNKSRWSTVVSHFGVRGGGFTSVDSLLRVSDRSEAESYFTSLTQRDSTVGFRGVRPVSGVNVNGGTIFAPDTICWSGEIASVTPASCNISGLTFDYIWYVKMQGEPDFRLLTGETEETLSYSGLANMTETAISYTFKRVAVCQVGTGESNLLVVKVMPQPFLSSSYSFNPCPVAIPHKWKDFKKYWNVREVANEIVEETENEAWVSGLASDGKYTLEVSWEKCPDVFSTEIEVSGTRFVDGPTTFVYTGDVQCVTLPAGTYKMECWGAGGGLYEGSNYPSQNYAGKGAYTSGNLVLSAPLALYIQVGGKGATNPSGSNNRVITRGGYNGGGNTYSGGGYGLGGGATDIRLAGGKWDNWESLKSRLMVAAGGGGSGFYGIASDGGGLESENSDLMGGYTVHGYSRSYGATQVRGGFIKDLNPNNTGTDGYSYENSRFGKGSDGTGAYWGGASGGGGYYGGGGAFNSGAGSGGSSFISGHSGCNAISAASTPGAVMHTGLPVHYSGFCFINTLMIDGTGYNWTTVKNGYVGMPTLDGTATMPGNAADGQVRITPL